MGKVFKCKIIGKRKVNSFFNIYYFEREYKQGRGAERERERENPKQDPHRQAESNMGLEITNCEIMTWAEIENQMLNWLSHPGSLKRELFLIEVSCRLWSRWLYPCHPHRTVFCICFGHHSWQDDIKGSVEGESLSRVLLLKIVAEDLWKQASRSSWNDFMY